MRIILATRQRPFYVHRRPRSGQHRNKIPNKTVVGVGLIEKWRHIVARSRDKRAYTRCARAADGYGSLDTNINSHVPYTERLCFGVAFLASFEAYS
ncbi:hypothetical protein EVAR_10162_1 [Eumeta japonica]|uniref:Uncharacterized protein n=1 Tax=Eumeta variegata TaxID=151549 RepID=A0A4C1TFY1_EUMVA|nr:hypothetical protein EVAR_10162_1 [Eumeta japonica]